jgi:putative membrane protein
MPPKLKSFLLRWLINTLSVMVAVKIVPGINYDKFPTLLVASLLLGILNAFLRPLLLLIALPLVILTLGFFYFVINAVLLMFVGSLVRGFFVQGFWPAFWGAVVITVMTWILNALTGAGSGRVRIQSQRQPPPSRPGDDDNGPVIDV